MEPTFEERVLEAIDWMQMAGLADYGRLPKNGEGKALMAEVWSDVLRDRGVRIETIPKTARVLAKRGGDFPDAGSFAYECNQVRLEMFQRIGVELADGSLFVRELPVSMDPEQRRRLVEQSAIAAGHALLALPERVEGEADPKPSQKALALLEKLGVPDPVARQA